VNQKKSLGRTCNEFDTTTVNTFELKNTLQGSAIRMAHWSGSVWEIFVPINRTVDFTWKFDIHWSCRPLSFLSEKKILL